MASRRRRGNPVLAPVSRWLLWSPWRLAAGVVAFLVVAAAGSAGLRAATASSHHAAGQSAPPPSTASASPEGTSVPSSGGSTGPTPTPPGSPSGPSTPSAVPPVSGPPTVVADPAGASDRAAATRAAVSWVTAWARPTLAAAAWRTGLRSSTYDDYLRRLGSVDPRNVPATRVAGTATVTRFLTGVAHVRVPVAGGAARAVEVTVIYYPRTRAGRWLVNDVTRI